MRFYGCQIRLVTIFHTIRLYTEYQLPGTLEVYERNTRLVQAACVCHTWWWTEAKLAIV